MATAWTRLLINHALLLEPLEDIFIWRPVEVSPLFFAQCKLVLPLRWGTAKAPTVHCEDKRLQRIQLVWPCDADRASSSNPMLGVMWWHRHIRSIVGVESKMSFALTAFVQRGGGVLRLCCHWSRLQHTIIFEPVGGVSVCLPVWGGISHCLQGRFSVDWITHLAFWLWVCAFRHGVHLWGLRFPRPVCSGKDLQLAFRQLCQWTEKSQPAACIWK